MRGKAKERLTLVALEEGPNCSCQSAMVANNGSARRMRRTATVANNGSARRTLTCLPVEPDWGRVENLPRNLLKRLPNLLVHAPLERGRGLQACLHVCCTRPRGAHACRIGRIAGGNGAAAVHLPAPTICATNSRPTMPMRENSKQNYGNPWRKPGLVESNITDTIPGSDVG